MISARTIIILFCLFVITPLCVFFIAPRMLPTWMIPQSHQQTLQPLQKSLQSSLYLAESRGFVWLNTPDQATIVHNDGEHSAYVSDSESRGSANSQREFSESKGSATSQREFSESRGSANSQREFSHANDEQAQMLDLLGTTDEHQTQQFY
jgi:hypothetical protein